jgi:predicted ribosomally synthesized peptide with SipW-like signal peptide
MKKLSFSILSFCLTLGILLTAVYAYFTDRKTTEDLTFRLGKVAYTISGNFSNLLIVPGQNIIDEPFILTNSSTIDTEIRVIISVTSSKFGTDTLDGMFGENDLQEKYYTMGTGWVLDGSYYYYRGGYAVETPSGIFRVYPSVTDITILSSIVLDGYKFTNDHANGTISISITLEAKQADFVTWLTLGTATYDFTTGQ